jgi:Asp-tRNA(Asn)/Glu-tRNA(Gln) amidotransferase A subunit family amidase
VSQLNAKALEEARILDLERKRGIVRSPAHGMPVLLKDLIDVKGMYTSNGNYSLRNSFPQSDSGVAEKLRERGVVILGKLGLSEYANFFGNQPSGFSNLTGQVLHGLDADQNPSGSSSGSGTAGAAALSLLTIGTETSGSIISPARAQGLVGLRPTVGLVPGVGIGPISASQDTAGPMDRTVTNAAYTLTAIAGQDP